MLNIRFMDVKIENPKCLGETIGDIEQETHIVLNGTHKEIETFKHLLNICISVLEEKVK